MGSSERFRRHLVKLANDEQVSLRWRDTWRDAECFVEIREALVPVPRRPSDYLIALHEIGHIANPLAGDLEQPAPTVLGSRRPGTWQHLTREAAAWSWAAEVALPVPWSAWLAVLGTSLTGHFRARLVGPREPWSRSPAGTSRGTSQDPGQRSV